MSRLAGRQGLISLLALLVAVLAPSLARAADPPTTVALTFDDGLANQYANAVPALAAHGLHGTFYLNTAHVADGSGYMTWEQVKAVSDAGNEIGGHTLDHANLTSLAADEATREVCNDRKNLVDRGFPAFDFAYPYGATNATVRSIVRKCGYNSARLVGGLVSPSTGSCKNCPYAQAIPPADPYRLSAPDSVTSTTSVSDLQTLVTQAQANGGVLVPIVFHEVCDNACSPRAITPADLSAFLDWLDQQQASGGVTVKTIHDVIGGSQQPAVAGPPPSGTRLQNESLEAGGPKGSPPYCWQAGGFGTNTRTIRQTSDAHTGSRAVQLTVSNYQNGDGSFLVAQDQGQCAPAVTAGRKYRLSSWYKATARMHLVAFYRDGVGTWHFLAGSPTFPVTSKFKHVGWTTPVMPPTATGLSFGPDVGSAGSVTVDDLGLTPAGAHPTPAEQAARSKCLKHDSQVVCARPGRPGPPKASARPGHSVLLSFAAPGLAGTFGPSAQHFLIKQSTRPITDELSFLKAQSVCAGGDCHVRSSRVGQRATIRVKGLRAHTRYFYAVEALSSAGVTGPRSKTVVVTTR